MKAGTENRKSRHPKYPGVRAAVDGSEAVVAMETTGSEAAGAYPITPSTQMGEGWAAAVAAGKRNVHGRKLIFFEPEGEHAAAAVTAGMSMTGLRATNFSSGQGIAYMHESLYAAVGKRLTYVLNVACRAMTKHSLNVHAGHDDYHAVDDTGFFQLFAKNVQEAADLNLIAHRIAELSLNPGICAQDGFLTSHVIESAQLPEPELVREYLGDPADLIESPTPAQRMVFGEKRRRIPEMFNLDEPAMIGVVQNQDSYAQGVAAQRPFYFDHIAELADRAMDEYAALTGRRYARASGYRLDDAEYVILGQGSVVWNAEAVADHLRETRGLKIGVLNLTMFRPFPADLVTKMLKGKKAVAVLERTDQPLAVDAPLLREVRAAMGKAVENGRSRGKTPHPELASCAAKEVPDFYSGCFGLGSRDLQPSDIIAAVDNMIDGGGRRQFYLGLRFVAKGAPQSRLQASQKDLLEAYPHVADLALTPADDVSLMPKGSVSIRIHSVGGWGAITTGKNLAMTAFDLLGWHIKANPKYGSEKKGQPTTFYGILAREPIRLNCELKHVDVVLCPDPNVFRHSNPVAGLCEGGILVIQSDLDPQALWSSFPASARRALRKKNAQVYSLDAFRIASAEAGNVELRYRMQGAAFMGAFFRVAPLATGGDSCSGSQEGLDEKKLLGGIRSQLRKKFGRFGDQVVEDNLRVIRRGFEEVVPLDLAALHDEGVETSAVPVRPAHLDGSRARAGFANPGQFWDRVCLSYKLGEDPLADPFAALSAIPAATSTIREMTDVRFEVPQFVPDRCTGCGKCWTACPDSAIPGLVNSVEQVIDATIAAVANGHPFDGFREIAKPLADECRRALKTAPFSTFADVLSSAYEALVGRLDYDAERRTTLDEELALIRAALEDFPLAKTAPFFDVPESREPGTGGLLSITVNPQTCKGCNLCVEVCPDDALVTVKQNDAVVQRLRQNWALWEKLPDTQDRYIQVTNLEEGIGVLPSLLLKRANYRSMFGGDGACMGCGEKTVLHLVLTAVTALAQPRVVKFVSRLDGLIAGLEAKARSILASGVDLESVHTADRIDIPVEDAQRTTVKRILSFLRDLRDLRWRYVEGPSGHGRAVTGFANATGCSSVWGSTYPYNPYPFPWTNHLFQDAPSIAIGIFEAHMRKMADGFIVVRRADLELAGEYDPAIHEPFFAKFDWRQFSDEEFDLCPPIFAVGGDGAMLDIGFQNLSRLMASGKPLRVVVLDTQVYSNTGGQACTSGFTGQISDMAAFGPGQRGKEETRKELGLIAMAHRGVFVLQSSQASPAHLLGGVLKGLQSRRPALFVLHSPCPPEHGIGDDQATNAARLALESRAFPFLSFDPDAGPSFADCLSLDGNPAPDDPWPMYEIRYVDEKGEEKSMELPLTIGDWAVTEGRFKKHFTKLPEDVPEHELIPFHEALDRTEDDGRKPFLYAIDENRRLLRLSVSEDVVRLARDRLALWSQLRELAGTKVPAVVRAAVESDLEAEFEEKAARLRADYEAKLADLKSRYPQEVARRLAEKLLGGTDRKLTVAELLAKARSAPGPTPAMQSAPSPAGAPTASQPVAPADGETPQLSPDAPYIESIRCTSCNECINVNKKMFAYDKQKQAYIKDPAAGTFRELVMAAERCPVKIIHPGAPRNRKERDLDTWIRRAEALG